MKNDTPARKKLVTFLKKHHPELNDDELPRLLNDIKRFVTVVQKIYTEPQAQIKYKEKRKKGVIEKYRVINTGYEELLKTRRKDEKSLPLVEAIKRLHKAVLKDNDGQHRT